MTRWAPERMRSFDRFNKMMDEMFGVGEEFRGTWSPCIDVKETDKELTFIAELPGMEEKDVSVDLHGDVLSIRGTREFNEEEKRDDYVRVERSYGSFQRSFTLDTPVKRDAISAQFKNGILTVVVPKATNIQPTKIEIKPG